MREPKLPRELNRGCKLTEKDIENIWALRSMDITLQEIADEYGVTKQAIYYVLKSDEEKKQINHRRHQRDSEVDKIKANEASKNARKYKRSVLREEMKKASREKIKAYRLLHPTYNREQMKKHYYAKQIDGKWIGAIEAKNYRKSLTTN